MRKFTLFFFSLILAALAQAQIIHVPADYPTIQLGIDAATSGDTVLVAEGTYFEQINFLGKKPLTVGSLFLTDGDTAHISNTIIDGSQLTNMQSASMVYFVSGEDTTTILCGFTIRHGKGTLYETPSNTYRAGGGVYISSSGAKIIHNHITENSLNNTLYAVTEFADGAGIGCKWNIGNHWIVVSGNTIDHNSCRSNSVGATGAGISINYNSRIIGNTISDNTLYGTGTSYSYCAGFYCEPPVTSPFTVTAIVEYNTIKNNLSQAQINQAHTSGVGFASVRGIFSHNIVENNEVSTGTNSAGGAAVLFWIPGEGSVVRNNTFRGNISNDIGALSIEGPSPDPDQKMVLVENNTFIDNEAKRGGAIEISDVPVVLQNNVFSGNHASLHGGAVYGSVGAAGNTEHMITFINNSFSGNRADVHGGVLYIGFHPVKPLIINSILWGDTATYGSEIYIAVPNDTVEIANSNFDPALISGGHFRDGGGNINTDPMFTDPVLLTTDPSSPCIDAGVPTFVCSCGESHSAPAYDILGVPRPAGSGYDMGAYDLANSGVGIRNCGPALAFSVWPNPCSASATFTYSLAQPSQVLLCVYDNLGRLAATLVNGTQQTGEQTVEWDTKNWPAGVYHYRILAGNQVGSGKMVKK